MHRGLGMGKAWGRPTVFFAETKEARDVPEMTAPIGRCPNFRWAPRLEPVAYVSSKAMSERFADSEGGDTHTCLARTSPKAYFSAGVFISPHASPKMPVADASCGRLPISTI